MLPLRNKILIRTFEKENFNYIRNISLTNKRVNYVLDSNYFLINLKIKKKAIKGSYNLKGNLCNYFQTFLKDNFKDNQKYLFLKKPKLKLEIYNQSLSRLLANFNN